MDADPPKEEPAKEKPLPAATLTFPANQAKVDASVDGVKTEGNEIKVTLKWEPTPGNTGQKLIVKETEIPPVLNINTGNIGDAKLLFSLEKELPADKDSYEIKIGSPAFVEKFEWKIISKGEDGKEATSETFTFDTKDTTPPRVLFYTVPDSKPKRLKIDDSIVVVFSEMITGSLDSANIILKKTSGNSVPTPVINTLHAKDRVLKITPKDNSGKLSAQTKYTITVKNLADRAGNKLTPEFSETFIAHETDKDFWDIGGEKFIALKKPKYKYDGVLLEGTLVTRTGTNSQKMGLNEVEIKVGEQSCELFIANGNGGMDVRPRSCGWDSNYKVFSWFYADKFYHYGFDPTLRKPSHSIIVLTTTLADYSDPIKLGEINFLASGNKDLYIQEK